MAEEKFMKIPYFARGKADSLERALTTGRFADGLDKALFYFATDTEQWILVDTDKSIHKITSAGAPGPGGDGNVKRVDQLPSILEADMNTLYIVGMVVYSFDGVAFHPTYEPAIGTLPPGMDVVAYVNNAVNAAIDSANQYTDEQTAVHIVQGG